jgi:hypothetical protein
MYALWCRETQKKRLNIMKRHFQVFLPLLLLMAGQTTQAQTSLNNLYFATSGNVGIGTANPQSTLAVNGVLTSQKVRVTPSGWSDFVFDNNYALRSLPELRRYIAANKHLPDVITAAQVKELGVDLGDNAAVLLRKIEELTLYLLQHDQLLEDSKAANEKLDAENKKLRAELSSLEQEVHRIEAWLPAATDH